MNIRGRIVVVMATAALLAFGISPKPTAAQGNTELVNMIAKGIGSSPQQAAGAAGSLFSLAQARVKPEEFSQVSNAVPGMDGLLKAAPSI